MIIFSFVILPALKNARVNLLLHNDLYRPLVSEVDSPAGFRNNTLQPS